MSPQWILVIGLIIFVYIFFIKKKPTVTKPKNKKTKKDEIESNDMVQCSTCSIYCELDDAILSNNKYYCSDECLEKA